MIYMVNSNRASDDNATILLYNSIELIIKSPLSMERDRTGRT